MENEPNAQADVAAEIGKQYSLAKILGIWALAAVPMGILGWVVAPALSADLDPLAAATTRIWALNVGLIWQFVLSMIIAKLDFGCGSCRLSYYSSWREFSCLRQWIPCGLPSSPSWPSHPALVSAPFWNRQT